ncbi:hypothetical protein [Streptobacillus moniliformis]|uniref:Uncharacterized protein n=1 Tax=Streptobacillus moniliformis (strain ATCC 14647 / DSM 12112 / NCTC 10651 / 9901) TaxID=519441 RepID=D1AWQ2_STRM9|nr:hypothetical protein [Streptobacillus moniliformis]ACZ00728.1 hypothetical protein Smon_0243 [Streptobacillus moniliformis DSM 12112]AVL42876.1 hypothetical protein CEP89_03030 [Streptobacillus moniliformis]QXW65484.1 hypothetical protein KX935_06830 [Streptobacillus moniliformis]SQA14143.1 Uncharacterised protein [Streptobacillus moniliformis]
MRNKGISLIYVMIFSSVTLFIVSTIMIFSVEKNNTIDLLLNEQYNKKIFEKEIMREKIRIIDDIDRSDLA